MQNKAATLEIDVLFSTVLARRHFFFYISSVFVWRGYNSMSVNHLAKKTQCSCQEFKFFHSSYIHIYISFQFIYTMSTVYCLLTPL